MSVNEASNTLKSGGFQKATKYPSIQNEQEATRFVNEYTKTLVETFGLEEAPDAPVNVVRLDFWMYMNGENGQLISIATDKDGCVVGVARMPEPLLEQVWLKVFGRKL